MTKEEALAPHIKMSDAFTSWVYAEDAKKAMDEYAKQTSIAFVKWAIEEDKIRTDSLGYPHIPLEEEYIYNQFIEQQNKP